VANSSFTGTGTSLANYALLASPTFTGTPAAPTAAADTNTTQLATTAYVIGQAYAKLASPTFTGTPTLPTGTIATTQAVDNNTTAVATTAFVLAQSASQADIETGTSTTEFVSAGRAQFHQSSAKAWAKLGVSGDVTLGYNVPSCADGGAGITTVTIGTDFSTANWACVVGGLGSGTTVTTAKAISCSSQAAGTMVLSAYDFSATPVLEDPNNFFFAGFGDFA